MNSISSIAGSALNAYSIRQNVTANNIANLNSADFKASTVVMAENPSGGVSASVRQGEDRVDLSREAIDMITTSNGYKANLKMVQASDEMTKELLRIKA